LAARLNGMKRRGMNDVDVALLHDMMESSELAALHIIEWLVKIQKSAYKNSEQNAVAKTILDWYKIKHGTAESNKKIEISMKMLTPEEREREVIRLLDIS